MPKAWVVATGAIAAFTSAGSDPLSSTSSSPDLLHRLFPLRRTLAPVRFLLKRWLANDLAVATSTR